MTSVHGYTYSVRRCVQMEARPGPGMCPRICQRICCVIDVSGSMGGTVSTGERNVSLLQLVKHAVVTMSRVLNERDELCIVTFSDTAQVVFPWSYMNDAGREAMETCLHTLQADGCTQMADGLMSAMRALQPLDAPCFDHVLLLTDGQATSIPPCGFEGLARAQFQGERHATLHTIGFGNNVDHKVLGSMARAGGGQFVYISDTQMLGTVFVHLVSNLVATAGARVQVDGEECGAVLFDQPRDIITVRDAPSVSWWDGSKVQSAHLEHWKIDQRVQAAALRAMWETLRRDPTETTRYALWKEVRQAADVPGAASMLEDLVGEVKLALQPAYIDTWGRLYVEALCSAHAAQVCTNFKDSSLQGYMGATVRALVDAGSQLFMEIPATMLQAPGATAVAQPLGNTFYDADSTCVHGLCRVRMADGTQMQLQDVTKGMQVRTGAGETATVVCKVKSHYKGKLKMSPSGLLITGYHPVLVDGTWEHPIEAYRDTLTMPRGCVVYSLVLDTGHTVCIDDVTVSCLGHGLSGDAIYHPFWGTNAVIAALQRSPQWDSGLVPVLGVLRDNCGDVVDLVV